MKNILFIFLLISFCTTAKATTYIFTGDINSMWDEPGNWTPMYPGLVLSESDAIMINYTCIIPADVEVTIQGTLLNPGDQLTIEGSLHLSADAVFDNEGICNIKGSYISAGETTNTYQFNIQEESFFENTGFFTNAFVIDFTNLFSIGESQNINSGEIINTGTIAIQASSGLTNEGLIQIGSGATFYSYGIITCSGTLENLDGDFDNYHKFILSGEVLNMEDFDNHEEGEIDITPTGLFDSHEDFRNYGSCNLDGELRLALYTENYGLITGNGTVIGVISNYGKISPAGNEIGPLTIDGTLSTFNKIEIDVSRSIHEADLISVSQNLDCSDSLIIHTDPQEEFFTGDEFLIFSAVMIQDSFDFIELPDCCEWAVEYNYPEVGDISIRVIEGNATTSLTVVPEQRVSVYPNPVAESLFIDLNRTSNTTGQLRISGVNGIIYWVKVIEETGLAGLEINVKALGLTSGQYILHYYQENNTQSQPFIVQ